MATVFLKGMVVDVITSVVGPTVNNKSLEYYKGLLTSETLKSIPRNTAIVKTISAGAGKTHGGEVVCYPFFSSHFCMPLKPGEYVWFSYENPDDPGPIAYWFSRLSETNHVEDVNFSFSARSFKQPPKKAEKRTSDKFDGPSVEPDEIQTYSWASPTSDPQELGQTIEFTRKIHRFEPVPRYSKRPGDLVIQGSNNSLIMLGEERGHFASNPANIIASSNRNDIPAGSSAIDIVVGRGKFGATQAKQIKNEFGIPENDKRVDTATEGDAHFPTDAARLYLTANSSEVNAPYHPDNLLSINLPSAAGRSVPTTNEAGSFSILKSDNLRIISRKAGSIRVIKEPTLGKADGAGLIMHPDGEMRLAANKFVIASYNSSGATEPYVKYTVLVDFLDSVMTDINTFCTSLTTAAGSLAASANAGGPVPGAQAAGATIGAAAASLQAAVIAKSVQLKTAALGLGSTVIYGE